MEDWAEFEWAPDSKALFLTHSVGYTSGYHVEVYRIVDRRLASVPGINDIARKYFERKHGCWRKETNGKWFGNDANVAGLKWVDGSRHILLVAEVPPFRFCSQPRYFAGIVVSLDTKEIIARYSPAQLQIEHGGVQGARLKSDYDSLPEEQRKSAP